MESIATIEIELMTLVRQLDTLGRKSSLYVDVDRAGYLALRTLERLGPVPTQVLADELHLDASTVTRQVTALVGAGFVARSPNPTDGRSSLLVLTQGGRQVMRRVEQQRSQVLQEMFKEWGDGDRRDLGRVLTKLNATLIERVGELRSQNSTPRRPAADAVVSEY